MTVTTIKVYDGEERIVEAVLRRKEDTGEVGYYSPATEKFYTMPEVREVGFQLIDTGVQYIDMGMNPASLRPKGEWKLNEDSKWACTYCERLAIEHPTDTDWQVITDFCPNCGADMRGEKDG